MIFCKWLLNFSSNLKVLLHICDTYYLDYLTHTNFRFYIFDFQLNTDFPSQFCVFFFFFFFIAKLPSVTQRSVSQENALKKSKNPSVFFSLKLSYSNWKQFQAFKKVKFDIKVTVHYSLWAKCTQLWPLNDNALRNSRFMQTLFVYLYKFKLIWYKELYWRRYCKYGTLSCLGVAFEEV